MIAVKKNLFIIFLPFLLINASCRNYATSRKKHVQNGYIITSKDYVFFLPMNSFDTSGYGFITNHKKYGIWLRGHKYSQDEMQKVMSNCINVPVHLFFINGNVDTLRISPAHVEYYLIDRTPKRIHRGFKPNYVFYLGNQEIKFDYFESIYQVNYITPLKW